MSNDKWRSIFTEGIKMTNDHYSVSGQKEKMYGIWFNCQSIFEMTALLVKG